MMIEQLKNASLSHIKTTFKDLAPIPLVMRQGFYRASFIGPWWLRLSARPSIALSGLNGWQGKKFIDDASATNILKNNSDLIEKLSMTCVEQPSGVDGKNAVVLLYGEQAPMPWRWVVDELRVLNENTLLCMTTINLPLLRHFSFPFILSRDL